MTHMLVLLGLLVPRCEYVAVTYDGNEYVVGSGDTCSSAMVGWQLPVEWRSIEQRQRLVWIGK